MRNYFSKWAVSFKMVIWMILGLVLLNANTVARAVHSTFLDRLTSTQVEVEVTGVIDHSRIQVGQELHVSVTINNPMSFSVTGLSLRLIDTVGIEVVGLDKDWPSELPANSYVGRTYTLKPTEEGEYNIAANVRYSPHAIEGRTILLGNVIVEPKSGVFTNIPRELWNTIFTALWTVISAGAGFTVAKWQEWEKRKMADTALTKDLFEHLWIWLKQIEDALKENKYPGEVVSFWKNMPQGQTLQYRRLVSAQPNLLQQINELVTSIESSEIHALKNFSIRAMEIRRDIENLIGKNG
ncbi:MAG: hypothetical protein C0410_06635 [Anaerolinea sp.]|nr:hypothetical protein [Anaerolinea sp.]